MLLREDAEQEAKFKTRVCMLAMQTQGRALVAPFVATTSVTLPWVSAAAAAGEWAPKSRSDLCDLSIRRRVLT
jgi:hypothetical protein